MRKAARGYYFHVNDIEYKFFADLVYCEKMSREEDLLGIKVGLMVIRVHDNKLFSWKEIKGTYLAEKITDFVKNTINGQATFYWDANLEEKFHPPKSS